MKIESTEEIELPIKLEHEPLIEVIFEIRFQAAAAAELLPGIFYSKIPGAVIERLPLADLPVQIRQSNVGFANQAIIRIVWDNYLLMIGDGMLGLSMQRPYAGWTVFKAKIFEIIGILLDSHIVSQVNRFAIKYVDLFEGEDVRDLSNSLSIKMKVGTIDIGLLPYQLTSEFDADGYRHVLQMAAPASVSLPFGFEKTGLVFSIDTAIDALAISCETLVENLFNDLDLMHSANKKAFFSCLTSDLLKKLEPVYANANP